MRTNQMTDWIFDRIDNFFGDDLDPVKTGCKHEACNYGVERYKEEIIVLASDDMFPEVKGWDDIIRDAFLEHWPDFDGVLHFHDGCQGEVLNTLCILGRKYYNRFGYIYSEEQRMLYGDSEFDAVSRILGRRKWIDRVIIRHMHPGAGHKEIEYDETYRQNDEWHDHDFKAFMRRKQNNFGLPAGT